MNFKFKTRIEDDNCVIRFGYQKYYPHGYVDEGYDYDGTEFGGFRFSKRMIKCVIRGSRTRSRRSYTDVDYHHCSESLGTFRGAFRLVDDRIMGYKNIRIMGYKNIIISHYWAKYNGNMSGFRLSYRNKYIGFSYVLNNTSDFLNFEHGSNNGSKFGSFRLAINYDLIGSTYPFKRINQKRSLMKRSMDDSSLYRSFFITKTDRSYTSNSKLDWRSEHPRYRNNSWNGRGFRITNDDSCISANWGYDYYKPELSEDIREISTKSGFKITNNDYNQRKASLKYTPSRTHGSSHRESIDLLKFKITSTKPYRSIRHGHIKTAYPSDHYWINRFKLVNIFN